MSKSIKVLLVGPVPPPYGGIPAYVKSLYDAKLKNIEYVHFDTANPSRVEPSYREGKRNYSSIFEFGVFGSIKKILYILINFVSFTLALFVNRPVIVQVFTSSYWGYWRSWVYILIAKFFRRKTIFHLLGAIDLFYEEVGNFQKNLLRQSLNSADCYLLQSPGLETWAKKYSRKEVIGIWNGIDFSQIPPKLEGLPESFASLKFPIGLTIGNLSINKGSMEIIEALSIIKSKNIQISWVFVGRGDVQKYKKIVAQKGLSQDICFTGEVNELEKWQQLYHASFYCLPSYGEGQPISIIEAMACKLPIISTKVGSIPEMITDNINGKLISPGDTEALVDAILILAQNPKLRDGMGKASYKVFLETHDIMDLYSGLSEIYYQLGGNSVERKITKQV